MSTEAVAIWLTFIAFFFWETSLLEVQAENRLNTNCCLGDEVIKNVPKQQWTECTITS